MSKIVLARSWIYEKFKVCYQERRFPDFIRRRLPKVTQQRLEHYQKCRAILKSRNRDPLDLNWKILDPAPVRLYDGGSVKIGNKFYVISGYSNINSINRYVFIYDLDRCKWVDQIKIPERMAHSHLAVSHDHNRYVYIVSGQRGAQCMPAVRDSFIFDTKTKEWADLPPLPMARYAATMQLWNGRLHIFGGSKEDRYSPANDYWHLGVKEGRAVEDVWTRGPSIPVGGCHRASAIVDDKLYAFATQQGDFKAIDGDPSYNCRRDTKEIYFNHVYVLDKGLQQWKRKADMPFSATHTEFSIITLDKRVILFGGQIFKDNTSYKYKLTDAIQEYDTQTDTWNVRYHLPYRIKAALVTYHKGWIYLMTGQSDKGADDDSPGSVINHVWRTKFPSA